MSEAIHQKIKVSRAAYERIKAMAAADDYRGRGIVGVIDKLVLGEFTTGGSGRPRSKQDKK